MKIGNKLLSSTILLCAFTFQVFAQTSITEEKIFKLFTYEKNNNISSTHDSLNTIALTINEKLFAKIISKPLSNYNISLPIDFEYIDFKFEKHDFYDENLKIISKTTTGDEKLDFDINFFSYKILYEKEIVGIINFYDGIIDCSLNHKGQQYEITNFQGSYFLIKVSDSKEKSDFKCTVREHKKYTLPLNLPKSSSQVQPCIQMAIEVDYYTRNTFNSNSAATNWALSIMAGVTQLYEAQANVSVTVDYIYVWNSSDPYSAYVNDAGNMLSALSNNWQGNTNVQRDLAHLLTKRTNTGTGGIAWLDGLCNSYYGCAFSANLNNSTNFNFPNPSYTWNLSVVTHEIGHNIGANHTHWCGWNADPNASPPFYGGSIDNCTNTEGSCPDNPSPQVGTIMSYCHLWGSQYSTLVFKDVVLNQAINPGISNASCLSPCSVDGCMDPNAINYNPAALNDDGSCCYVSGCTDSNALNYDPNACYDDGSCIQPVLGCTDPSAANFDPLANVDDGLCCYGNDNLTINITTDNYPTETRWYITNQNGVEIDGINSGDLTAPNANYNWDVCVDLNDCYTFWIEDSYGDGICCQYGNGSFSVSYNGAIIGSGSTFQNSTTIDNIFCNIILGCTDPAAANYDSNATNDDGSCTYPCTNNIVNLNFTPDCYGEETSWVLQDDNGSILYSVSSGYYPGGSSTTTMATNPIMVTEEFCLVDGCYSFIVSDSYGDGVNGSQWSCGIDGDYQILDDSGNILGSLQNVNFGTSETSSFCLNNIINGCTDPVACNYDINANNDDGSCIYPLQYYDCSGNCINDIDLDEICDELEISGCTDINADNYDLNATDDDGSCLYSCSENTVILEFTPDCYGEETSWVLQNDNGSILYSVSSGYYPGGSSTTTMATNPIMVTEEFCLVDGCYSFIVSDSYGDGMNGSQWSCGIDGDYQILDDSGNILGSLQNVNFGTSETSSFCLNNIINGCTDPVACNYDINANNDDGSCIYPLQYYDCSGNCINDIDLDEICDELEISGCTDINADNYDSNATDDDGSCIYCSTFALSIDSQSDATAVGAADGSATVTASGGTSPYSINWPADPSSLAAGTYTVTATDAEGCTTSIDVTIDEPSTAVCSAPTGLNTFDVVHTRATFNFTSTGADYYKIRVKENGGAWQVITQLGTATGTPGGSTKTKYF